MHALRLTPFAGLKDKKMNYWRVPATAVALLLSLTVLGCNESSSPTAPTFPPVSASYSVFGQVTAASSHAPLEGARIEVTDFKDGNTHVTASDGSGLFRISGLRAALYLVAVSREGFERSERSVDLSASNSEVPQDFLLLEKGQPGPAPGELTGEWSGTFTPDPDPVAAEGEVCESEAIRAQFTHTGSAVSGSFLGTCSGSVQFTGSFAEGELKGKVTITFEANRSYTGTAAGQATVREIHLITGHLSGNDGWILGHRIDLAR